MTVETEVAALTSAVNLLTSTVNVSKATLDASVAAAEAAYDSFDDRYLGAKVSAPSLDNDGGSLLTGALYFNSTENAMYVYTGASWVITTNYNNVTAPYTLAQTLNTNGNNVTFGDNGKAIFGAGSDLQIYHDGTTNKVVGSIDVTGTATMDGLTVDGNVNIADAIPILRLDSPAVAWAGGEDLGGIDWYTEDASGDGPMVMARLVANSSGANTLPLPEFTFQTSLSSSALIDRLKIHNGGDISFFEDQGVTPKFFWDASAERLGVGTSSPSQKLSVADGAHITGANAIAADTSGSYTLAVGANGGSKSAIFAGDVIASGNLLVGKTADNNAVAGVALSGSGIVKVARTDWSLLLNRLTTDGELALFQKDGTTVGSIGSNSGYMVIGSPVGTDAHLLIGNGLIHPATSTGAAKDNAINIGGSSNRFKDLYLSGGVYLGGTGAANLLDDYEEGDYDVTITCGTSGTVTLNSSFNRGAYTKVGRLVTVHGFFVVDSVSSPVGFFQMNLPFTPASLTDRAGDVAVSLVIQNVVSANISDFVGTINEGDANIYVQLGDATTVQNDSAQQLAANTYIIFSATYSAA